MISENLKPMSAVAIAMTTPGDRADDDLPRDVTAEDVASPRRRACARSRVCCGGNIAANPSAICVSLSRKKNESTIAENAMNNAGRGVDRDRAERCERAADEARHLRGADLADVEAVRRQLQRREMPLERALERRSASPGSWPRMPGGWSPGAASG